MKQTTKVWAKFSTAGAPEKTKIVNDSVRSVIMYFASWIVEPGVYLKSKISLNIAMSQEELVDKPTKEGKLASDMADALNDIFGEEEMCESADAAEQSTQRTQDLQNLFKEIASSKPITYGDLSPEGIEQITSSLAESKANRDFSIGKKTSEVEEDDVTCLTSRAKND